MKPTLLIIFGATGDLARRYLLPAVEKMKNSGTLPQEFELIEASRSIYESLPERVKGAEKKIDEGGQKFFHLAIPTKAYKETLEYIRTSGIATGDIKVLLEKPFGFDSKSAEDLVKELELFFKESEIYRVDHYLARHTVQAILKRRLADFSLESKWNKDFIERIEITASEKIDIEGRVNFYEHTGALRDWVQGHLLEVAAIVLMKLPAGDKPAEVPSLRHEALKKLDIVCDITKNECVKRGQYAGYKKEVNNPKSTIETFVSLNLISHDPVWRGVPITLTAGKALKEKFSTVTIFFRDGEKFVFDLAYHEGGPVNGYVEVYLAAFGGLHHLFASKEEIIESWRILDAVQKTWENAKEDNIIIYQKGSAVDSI